ncbi:YggT family protein [bacterium]|nr:YggT family protein [bacterium]
MVRIVYNLFQLYFILIILYCFMSFFPRLDRNSGAVRIVATLVEPYLAIFRRFIPPAGGLDFSPIIAMIVLQILQVLVCSMLSAIY